MPRPSKRKGDSQHAGGYCWRVGKIDPVPPGETCGECGAKVDEDAVPARIVRVGDGYAARYPERHPNTGAPIDWEE